MQENGIYNKWEGTYLNNNEDVDVGIVSYETTYLKDFYGMLVICIVMMVFGTLVVGQEIVGKKRKEKKVANKKIERKTFLVVEDVSHESVISARGFSACQNERLKRKFIIKRARARSCTE